MSELTQPQRKRSCWQRLRQNPVVLKELRSRMRGRRAFVVLSAYLLFMSLFLVLVYLAYLSANASPASSTTRDVGKVMFSTVVTMQVFLVVFIAPAFTAGAITGEKERQTYDLVQTTLLSAPAFVLGKLISALSYIFLLVLASIPLQSISFLLGGLSLEELVVSQLLILVGAVAFALYGLYCSARMRTTLAAVIAAFGGSLFVTLGLPLVVLLLGVITSSTLLATGSLGGGVEAALALGGVILSATNLPATLIMSEVVLQQYNTLFFYRESFSGVQIWLFSPWWLALIFHLLIAFFLYLACVRRVREVSEQ